MSTRCKIEPMVRVRRAARANLLRQRAKNAKQVVVLAELALIRANPRLHGNTKHDLFARGAYQLQGLE